MKVLIVDDVGLIRRTLEQVMTRNGYSAVTAESGVAALELLQNDHTIRAVITDLNMPGMDGIELFKAARKIERITDDGIVPAPEFILLTAEVKDDHLNLALNLGFVQVFRKPPDEDRLLSQLAKIENQPGLLTPEDASKNSAALSMGVDGHSLSHDLVLTIEVLLEAIEVLIAFEDTEALIKIHKLLNNPYEKLSEAILETSGT